MNSNSSIFSFYPTEGNMLLERMIQHVRPGRWAELEAIDKKYNAIETRHGFPPKKRYQALFGGSNNDTLIIEREWESLTKMEATFTPYLNDPETQKLQAETNQVLDSVQTEMYWVLP